MAAAATPVRIGAVLYDPKVAVIWEIIRDYFEAQGVPITVAFYSTYELQNDALLAGDIDIAWNSPLAWLDAQRRSGGTCRAVAMRDTDRDRVSHILAAADGPVRRLEDLRGHTLAVGAADSPQATLIPLGTLRRAGLEPRRDVAIVGHDVLVGKHGDHVGGELDAFRCLARGDAQASAMLDLNWDAWTSDGTIDPNAFRIVASTPRFDHCVFTVRAGFDADVERAWVEALFRMTYDDPSHRHMMDLEGLRAWLPGRTSGFDALAAAVRREGFFVS